MPHRPKRTRVPGAAPPDLVVFACAASAGIHAGIVPEHLREEPRLGIAFLLAVGLLLMTAVAVARHPASKPIAQLAALLLGALTAAYLASRTTGSPLLSPAPEAIDPVGIASVAVEVAGVASALRLSQPSRRHRRRDAFKEVAR